VSVRSNCKNNLGQRTFTEKYQDADTVFTKPVPLRLWL
jgi:hypothetical protein